MFKLKYFWPYLLFFVTIVLLVTANRIHIKKEIARNLSYTKTLNVAGRQRMYSQKLAKLSGKAADNNKQQREIRTVLEQWEHAHNSLKNNTDSISIYAEDHPEVQEMFHDVTPVFESLVASFRKVANGSLTEETLRNIAEQEPVYLQDMDAIVNQLELNAKNDLIASQKKQRILALISGLLLLLEMVVFIYPYHKRLVHAYKKVKKQQEELEAQKSMIEHLFETNELIIKGTNAGIWEWNIKTDEEQWSDRFYHILGYEPGDIPSTYSTFLNVLLHPDDREKIKHVIEQHLEDREPYKHEIRMLNKNGQYRWYETSGQAIWNDEGKPIRMAGSIIDITERISTREKLLSESSTKDRLLSIVAHDLRSPVNNLISLLDLLKENVINKEEFLEHLQATSQNVHALSESMDNMLTWAQSQLSGWKVTPSEIRIDDVVKECIGLHKNAMEEKGIHLECNCNDVIKAYADFNQMVLIVRNVLNNAIKFTPENGAIFIIAEDGEKYASISVKDSGKGMDKETIDMVLDKKNAYSTRGTNGEKGTGLGMSMCIEFAEKNDCILNIESELSKGTTVSLSIPKSA